MKNYIYGLNTVKEAISANRKIYEVIINKEKSGNLDFLNSLKNNVEIKYMGLSEMNRLFKGNHQGFVALIEWYEYRTLEESLQKVYQQNKVPFYIILDGIEDPHNLGAVIRTAEAAGLSGVIIPKNRSVDITPTVAKVSSGGIEYIDIIRTNVNQAIQYLKNEGIWIVGTSIDAEQKHYEIDGTLPLSIVIGNEGKGISRLVKENCDYLVKIPMLGKANSLNASVSAGVVIFEFLRQRLLK